MKQKSKVCSAVVFVVSGLIFLSLGSSPPEQGTPEDEEFSVYAVVIEKSFLRPRVKRVVIQSETDIEDREELDKIKESESRRIKKSFAGSGLRADTVADFFARNHGVSGISDRFDLPVSVVVLDVREFERQNQLIKGRREYWTRYWPTFYQRYPDSSGIITLSRVGFDPKRTQAFLYARNVCGRTCGTGMYYYLLKRNGSWKIISEDMLWIS